MGRAVDWEALRRAARQAAANAYAPYSGFRVGAAGLTDDGRLVTGCNVENLSYGLTLCAECGLVSDLHATGGGRLVAVAVVSGSGEPCPPCGRCRQLLLEHGGGGCLVDGDGTPRTVDELLPGGFSPERLRQG
jgi:cytidine deaminase